MSKLVKKKKWGTVEEPTRHEHSQKVRGRKPSDRASDSPQRANASYRDVLKAIIEIDNGSSNFEATEEKGWIFVF